MAIPSHIVTSDGLRLAVVAAHDGCRLLVPNGAGFIGDFTALWARHPPLVYDLRNRGASDPVVDASRLARGVLNDVDDLETVRRAAGLDGIDLLAHSYVGVVAMRYAMAHPDRVRRVVLLAPAPLDPAAHPAPPPDATMRRVFARLAQLQTAPPPGDAEARCRAFWDVLAEIYVADPALAPRVAGWGRCDLPNERGFMSYWSAHVQPSLAANAPTDTELARVTCPVLVVHGTADRSAAYAGGRAWARRLPDARLLTVEGAAHAPWIERPAVIGELVRFFDGDWPAAASRVTDDDALDGRSAR
jgi:pimeloyl-ACP methyl ester carboxylesterase